MKRSVVVGTISFIILLHHMKIARIVLRTTCLIFGLCYFFSACNEQSSLFENEIFFPTQKTVNGERAIMGALLIGKLVKDDSYLRIQAQNSETSYLVIWPPGYTFRIAGRQIEILDEQGKMLVKVGEDVLVDGGETHTVSGIAIITEDLQQELSSRGAGPYWIIGAEVRPFDGMGTIAK